MIRNKQVAKALQYSTRNPHAKLADVAKKFGVTRTQVYAARYNHGATNKPTVAKSKKRDLGWIQLPPVTTPKPAADMVNHPPHYKSGGIETIDFIEAKGLNYNLGNVVKYITRAGVKNKATHIEDLEKAAWYLNREIANLKGGA